MQTTIRRIILFTLPVGLMCIGIFGGARAVRAQSCGPIIAQLNQGISECSDINSNWVCYASPHADVKPEPYRFYQPRDRRPFSVLEEVNMLDDRGTVLMNLQLTGEAAPLKVIVFGQVDLQNRDPYRNILFLGFKDDTYLCDATPPGMMVQTAQGATGFVTVNGVDIELSSTSYVTVQADGRMAIAGLEGDIRVTIGTVTQILQPGQQTLVAFSNGQPSFVGPPSASPLFASPVAQWLTVNGLPSIHNTNTTDMNCVGEIKFDETIVDANVNPGQECLYRFCAKAGDVVTVQMNAIGSGFDTWLDLRAPGDRLVGVNDDIDSDNPNSLICNRVMPLTSCRYTIVARSTRNASFGQFRLTLGKQTDCKQPELRCSVVAPRPIALHQGPNVDYPIIQTLPTNTQLHPKERTADGDWAYVQVLGSDQEGWVNQVTGLIECEDDGELMPVVTVTATPEPPIVIDPNGKSTDCKEKCSPFGEP